MSKQILKVLVGSRAHGLAREDSDYDYRGVFVVPTTEILKLNDGQQPKYTTWAEANKAAGEKEDLTAWEIGHYLHLATHCNPTILEVLAAPPIEATYDGQQLQELFPHVWHPKRVRDAFVGYGLNQRKKFLEDKDTRPAKYASAYLRVLYQAHTLLTTGTLPIHLPTSGPLGVSVAEKLTKWRAGDYTKGEVIDECLRWQQWIEDAFVKCYHEPDLGIVNDFLLRVRRTNW